MSGFAWKKLNSTDPSQTENLKVIMSLFKRKRLIIATTVYWVLLIYIISLLFWWFIALQSQSRQMSNYRLQELKMDDPHYETRLNAIRAEEDRKTAQYIGEGSTFLLLI